MEEAVDQCNHVNNGAGLEKFETRYVLSCPAEVIFIAYCYFSLLEYRVAKNVTGQGQTLSSILAAKLQ